MASGISRTRVGIAPATKPVEILQLVGCRVGDGDYAVDIMRIKEIVNPMRITSVPKAPSFVEGVIELRGAILPVVDLRKRFDLSPTPLSRASKLMIVVIEVADHRMIVALVVDGVTEPLRVPRQQIRTAPPLAQGETAYFTGVIHHLDRIYMVLDLDALLTSREKVSLVGMAAPPGAGS